MGAFFPCAGDHASRVMLGINIDYFYFHAETIVDVAFGEDVGGEVGV